MAKASAGSKASKKGKTGAETVSSPKRRRKRRPAQPDPTPVLSGRLLAATFVLAGVAMIPFMGVGKALEPDSQIPADTGVWAVGKSAKVHLTLITADFNKLSCHSQQTFKGYHCQFKTETQAFPRDPGAALDDNKSDLIQPYRTHGTNKLIFVGGLWATPGLATRLHFEPPRGVAESKLARFVAECEVNFVGQMNKPGIRWSPSGKWIQEGNPLVAIPKSCRILDQDES
jgi:hypothetical protein